MDKRKVAKIILDEIEQNAPVTINRNFEKMWINVIVAGLTKAEKVEIPGAATPRKSKG